MRLDRIRAAREEQVPLLVIPDQRDQNRRALEARFIEPSADPRGVELTAEAGLASKDERI